MTDLPPRPKTMTWAKAAPILAAGGLFDVLRYAFLFFWLWGPAVASYAISSYYGGGFFGHAAATVAGVAGYTAAPALTAFGTVMSIVMAVGGWLLVLILMFITDARVVTKNTVAILWLLEGIMGSTFLMAFFLFRQQIRKERTALKEWERSNAAALRDRQAAQLARAAQLQAANDNEEIPEDFAETA